MTPTRYSTAAISLHWLIAAALAFQIALGWALEGPDTAERFARYQLHKSLGITILLLTLVRLAIRFTVPRPAPSEGPAWAVLLAKTVHVLFYVALIVIPLSGWVIVSTSRVPVPTLVWGVIPWPHLPLDRPWHKPAETVHGLLAWGAIILFLLHVAGALRQQWLLGKPELQRMIPFAKGRGVIAAIAAFALIGVSMVVGKSVLADKPGSKVAAGTPQAPEPQAVIPAEETAIAAGTTPEAAATEDAAGNATAPATETEPLAAWAIDTGGRLGFTASWNGDAIEGRFERWSAEIRYSPDALDQSTIRARIDLASVSSGDAQRDGSLTSSDFFNVAAHPSATFSAKGFRHIAGDNYEARGTLDLRGVSRPVALRFTLRRDGDRATVRGSTRIDRTSFGVGQGEWASTDTIAGNVDIAFGFTARRQQAAR